MNFDVFIPVLDALSKAMEAIPNPWIAGAGVLMAAALVIWRKVRPAPVAPKAEVIQLRAVAPAEPKAEDKVAQDIVNKTLKGE